MAISLKVNGASRSVPAEPDTPLLYVLRNDLALNGAKFGCGLAQCGACTVLVDGKPVRSCVTADRHARQRRDHHHRGARHDRQAASAAEGLHRRAGGAVRLLHQRHDHDGQGTARPQAAADRGRRARGARRQSLPLRHPQPHRRAPSCAPRKRDGEDLTMNAPTLTRRSFAKGLGGIVLAFSLDAGRVAGAGRRGAAARQPQQQPHARCLAAHQRRRHRHRVHRQGRARAGHPHRAVADRGRGARSAAVARHA